MGTALVEVDQDCLPPNTYEVGGGKQSFSAEVLANYVTDTNRALESNPEFSPVLDKHTQLGATDEEHAEAAKGTDGKGWLRRVWQKADGTLVHRLAVAPDIKKGIDDGTIRFTSPYFWPGYKSADGSITGNVIRHVALTPKPRNPNQGPFVPVAMSEGRQLGWQFSLEDAVTSESKADKKLLTMALLKELGAYCPSDVEVSLTDAEFDACLKVLGIVNDVRKAAVEKDRATMNAAPARFGEGDKPNEKKPFPPKKDGDGDGKTGEGAPPAKPAEGDAPPADPAAPSGGVDLAGLVSQVVTELNVSLPEGVDPKSEAGLTIILVAVLNAAKGAKAAPAAGGVPQVKEEPIATAQFSETEKAFADRITSLEKQLAAKNAAGTKAGLAAKLRALPPGLRTRLESILGGVQFSADGAEQPRLTVGQVADLLKEGLPAGFLFDDAKPTEAEHPDGAQFFEGGGKNALSPERQAELVKFAGGGPAPGTKAA